MKPQKRIKIMKGIIKNATKGTILTLNEDNHRYYTPNKKTSFSEVTINDLGESIAQPLSADGLLLADIIYAWENNSTSVERFHTDWSTALNLYDFISGSLHLYRLKPQPKFIPVPDCVKLCTYVDGNAIINNKRCLYIHKADDGLPCMESSFFFSSIPHQINPTPIAEFEDGAIYYAWFAGLHEALGEIFSYYTYCKKENTLYAFTSKKDHRIRCEKDPNVSFYRKVTPTEA